MIFGFSHGREPLQLLLFWSFAHGCAIYLIGGEQQKRIPVKPEQREKICRSFQLQSYNRKEGNIQMKRYIYISLTLALLLSLSLSTAVIADSISSLCSTQECSDYLKNVGLLGFHRFDIMPKGPIGLQTYGRSISNDERTFLYFARFSE